MIRLKPIIEAAKGQMPMPASRPDWAGSRPNSRAQVLIRNIRAMNPNAVVTRAMKQPQKRTWSCVEDPASVCGGCGWAERTELMRAGSQGGEKDRAGNRAG